MDFFEIFVEVTDFWGLKRNGKSAATDVEVRVTLYIIL